MQRPTERARRQPAAREATVATPGVALGRCRGAAGSNGAAFGLVVLLGAFVAAALAPLAQADAPIAEVDPLAALAAEPPYRHMSAAGFRASHYRALTPADTPYGSTLASAEALVDQLAREPETRLVDVQAITLRPESAELGMGWLPNEPRFHLPGSTWLPNVGAGELDEVMNSYFRRELHRISGGRRDHPIVLYCVLDCWMSWNAVKRAHGYGYGNLFWYRLGSDGWEEAGLPLVEGTPVEIGSP